ncbi:ROK family protein [Plantibacter sp. Mn2098]|uniref:ROK family transcriptional regulator n=1 Tax=Plantibacter sp. Mn2098 TaxID=3395266 RepID=UPI003BE4EF6B
MRDLHDDPRRVGVRLGRDALSARIRTETVGATFARLIASGDAETRADLARVTGLSRTTVSTGVEFLQDRGVLRTIQNAAGQNRGRPSDSLILNARYGVILVADLGIASTRLSIYDLNQRTVALEFVAVDLSTGPEDSVPVLLNAFTRMIDAIPEHLGPPRICVVGVPGPVDARRGEASRPPILSGWKSYDLAAAFESGLGCSVIVEKDVSLRALGEARSIDRSQSPLVYIKVASGIEAGIVTADGELYRGAHDAAGDLGHIRVVEAGDALCTCGNTGCLATIASTTSLVQARAALRGPDSDGETLDDFEAAIRAGEPDAVRLLRTAAGAIGEVTAGLVNFFNPSRIIVGGSIASVSDDILAGVRSVVYQRSLPLATRNLTVSAPRHGHLSGAAGGLALALERLFCAEELTDDEHRFALQQAQH